MGITIRFFNANLNSTRLLTVKLFTENPLHVSLIRSDNYDPSAYCDFETVGDETVALVPGLAQKSRDFWPFNEIAVGPPTPIYAVTCRGYCLPNYGKLEFVRCPS